MTRHATVGWSHKIPDDAERDCPKCGRRYKLLGRPHFDADGSAMIGLICTWCRIESVHYWAWKWSL